MMQETQEVRKPEGIQTIAEEISDPFLSREMDEHTFRKFTRLIYKDAGITLGPHKVALVCARVAKRMRKLGINDFRNYYRYVTEDDSGAERIELINVISTNVTHFFREERHLNLLGNILQDIRDRGQERIRIWSTACSTGEEPYSIAMVLKETLPDATDAKILATDISTNVLSVARHGLYEEKHVSRTPDRFAKKYFTKEKHTNETLYRVRKELREMTTFARLNLAKAPFPLNGPLDVVFCRNVMIYFDNEVRKRLLSELYRLIRPGGFLMVGHAESLSGMLSDFKLVEPSVYTKA